jgi:hypothetical protein
MIVNGFEAGLGESPVERSYDKMTLEVNLS